MVVVRYHRVILTTRHIEWRNVGVPAVLDLLLDDPPVVLVGPDGAPSGLGHGERSVGTELLQVLFFPVLWVLGKVEEVLVVLDAPVLLFLLLLQVTAVQGPGDPSDVDLRGVLRLGLFLSEPGVSEVVLVGVVGVVRFVGVGFGVV
jgi:hypothetical protein